MSAKPPVFEARKICKTFTLEGKKLEVLKNVDFSVKEGSWTALVGRSGSGKTTLLHLLGALDKPTSGDIVCRGRSFRKSSRKRRNQIRLLEIGFVFQSYHLFPELNAHENVMLPSMHWGWNRNRARERAAELLTNFGLGNRLSHRPRELSGGEQQRVSLARALMNNPDIILADEPTGNLDVEAGKEIIGHLQKLHEEQGKTILMVTHDLELTQYAEQILVMRSGSTEMLAKGAEICLDD